MTIAGKDKGDLRRVVLGGVAWNGAYQVFSIAVQFAAMLITVRLVPPAEFGRVAAVIGLLHLLNAFGCGSFMAHALQLPADEEPDWTLHWHCGLWIQSGLTMACLALAGAAMASSVHRELAPLLVVTAIGVFVDAPSRLRIIQLQRALDFRRLRIASAVSTILSIATTLGLAILGWGALALVVGGNLVVTLGFTLDLFLIERWRPQGLWFCWPHWSRYQPALRFGMTQGAAGALRLGRTSLAALVLPVSVGYEALGLLGRAEALFASTVQRLTTVVGETIYPVLPQCASDEARFQRVVSAYYRTVTIVLLIGGAFLAIEGASISRLFYGPKWVAADPYLTPMTIAGVLTGVFTVAYRVLLARNRIMLCLRLDAIGMAIGATLVLGTLVFPDPHLYSYGLATAAAISTIISLAFARGDSLPGVLASLGPPAVAAAFGSAALYSIHFILADTAGLDSSLTLMVRALAFGIASAVTLRIVFPSYLATILSLLPGGTRVLRLLRLTTRLSVGTGSE